MSLIGEARKFYSRDKRIYANVKWKGGDGVIREGWVFEIYDHAMLIVDEENMNIPVSPDNIEFYKGKNSNYVYVDQRLRDAYEKRRLYL